MHRGPFLGFFPPTWLYLWMYVKASLFATRIRRGGLGLCSGIVKVQLVGGLKFLAAAC